MRAVLFACCFGALIAAVVSQSGSASTTAAKPTYQYVDPWFNAPDNLNTNSVAAVAASGQPYAGSNIGSGSGLANNPSYPTGGYTPVNGGATTVSAGAAASAAGSGSTGAGAASAAAGVTVAIPGGGPATTPGIAMDPLSGYDPFGRPIMYWNGDCSSQKCQNGGTCYTAPTDPYVNPYDPSKDPKNKPPKDPYYPAKDPSSYPDPSYDPKNNYGYNPYDPYATSSTTGVTGVQDLSNARDTDAALTAALAGQQVPVSASPTVTTNRYIPNQGITPQAVGGSTGSSGTTASGSGSGSASSSSPRAYCRCPSGYSGTYCDVRTCSDPTINCAAAAPVALMVPPNTVAEFGDNTSPTSAGTGAAIATDSCSTAAIAVSDATTAGTQSYCPVSSTITRTFTAQDGCNNFASGTQTINVVDTTPPKITVTFDPLPPIAVTADQITLTPMQVQRLLLVLLKLGKVSKDALLLGVVGGPFNLLGGSGLLGLNANSEIGTLLGLIGASPSSSLADIFGDDTAKLMTDVGFNMTTATNWLQSALTSSSATIQAGGSGSAFDPISGVANALNNAGLPVRAVQVPVQQNDHFASWLTSDIALPVGVQVCERPSTRVFRVNCTVYDAGTPAKYLKAAARLHVTHITNRRKVGVQIDDPFKKNMKDMEKDMFDKFGKMKMPDMGHLFDEMKMKKMNMNMKPLSVDGSGSVAPAAASSSTATVTPLSNFEQIVSDAMKKMPYDPNDSYDSYDSYDNYDYDPKQKKDPYNSYDSYGDNNKNKKKNDNNYNKKDNTYKKEDPKEKKKKENDPPVTTTVIAGQCATKDDYVDLHCGDYVSITLDAEDACLADNFDDDDHMFMDKHTFDINDFKQFGEDKRFQQQQWLTSSKNGKMDIVTVRGTVVEFEAVAEDGCGNVGYGVSDPARDCEAFVAGVCCPPVTNAVSAFVRDQVLQADGNNMNMKMPTLQLADALKQALKLPL